MSIHFGTTERLERHEIGADIHPSLCGVNSTRGALGWRGKAAADFAAEAEHFSDVHGEFIHVRKEGWQDWAIPTVLLIGEQCENRAPWRRGEGVRTTQTLFFAALAVIGGAILLVRRRCPLAAWLGLACSR